MVSTLTIQLCERRVLVNGCAVRLRAKSFDVLALLASRPGHLYAKELLIDRVWQGRSVSPDVLTGTIREIRRALGDRPRSAEWIETVSGTGYRLLKAADIVAGSASAGSGEGRAEIGDTEAASAAVLGFVARDPGLASMAEALARDIAVGLARTRWIQVAASASVEALAPDASPRDAADRLGVRYVVEGDLRRTPGGFSLQASLAEVERNRILWADRVAAANADVVVLMDDVCTAVVATVEAAIEAEEMRRAELAPVRSMDAWIHFHRGMSRLRRYDASALDVAGRILHEAARADPACARIAAARSWQCWQRVFFGLTNDRQRTLAAARDFAAESIALDGRDPLGHWALGRTEWLADDIEAACVNLERAVALNPSFAMGQYSLGISLNILGRAREAAARCDAALRLSPLDPMAFAFHCLRAQIACFADEAPLAIHHARQAADHPNVHAFGTALAAWVHELSGNRDAALDCIARLRRRWPSHSRAD